VTWMKMSSISVLKASPRRPGGGLTPRRLARLPRLGVQAVVQRLGPPYRFKNHVQYVTQLIILYNKYLSKKKFGMAHTTFNKRQQLNREVHKI
jgi:hypothetical protein